MEQLLNWPYRRWIKAFAAWTRRKAVEAVDRRQEAHIAALYSNTNYDSQENDREGAIKRLGEYYDQLRDVVGRDPEEVRKEAEALRRMEENDPFLRAGRRNMAISVPVDPMMPGEESIQRFA